METFEIGVTRGRLRAALLVGLVASACGVSGPDGSDPIASQRLAVTTAGAMFDCGDPQQALQCPAPSDPNLTFVCHGAGKKWLKLAVSRTSSGHVIGQTHGNKSDAVPDLRPGASASETGSGTLGLDCECNARECRDSCTGAQDGTPCAAGDLCTFDGLCLGGICQQGGARCTAGIVVDRCVRTSGACEAGTGACLTEAFSGNEPTACGAGCLDCTSNATGATCVNGRCGCVSDADCTSDAAPQCDTSTGACGPCGGASGEQTCLSRHGGKHCESVGSQAGQCAACRLGNDGDCPSPTDPVCTSTGGTNFCGGCTEEPSCMRFGPTFVCDSNTGDCVGCVTDSECLLPSLPHCVNRMCLP
jgi:hypothetical protein